MAHHSENDPKPKFAFARRIASVVAGAFRTDPYIQHDEKWKKDFKVKLFQHNKYALIEVMKISPEKVLFASTLLLNEDYQLSAGWALVNAVQEKVDLTVAKPYLVEGLSAKNKNVRSQCARCLTLHYLNTDDLRSLKALAEPDDASMRRDIFDAANAYATDAHPSAIKFLVMTLGHPDRSVRELALGALELAVELGEKEARELIKNELEPHTKAGVVTNLLAFKAAEKICKSIELKERRSS